MEKQEDGLIKKKWFIDAREGRISDYYDINKLAVPFFHPILLSFLSLSVQVHMPLSIKLQSLIPLKKGPSKS